jgi:pimeloyl-ACP methyl ester carboxylesterase
MDTTTPPATLRPHVRAADGLAIRYAESPRADAPSVLLLNPWPESLFAWQTVWPALAQVAHLVAIDLPGFGGSEHRDALMGPEAMGGFVARLIDEWELDSPHVMGFDVGSGAALFAATEPATAIRSLVVGSGGTLFPLQLGGSFDDIVNAPTLDTLKSMDGRDLVASALEGIEHHVLPAAVREDYLSSYAGDRFVQSAAYVRSYARDLPVLGRRLAMLDTPTHVISGARDPWVPPANAEFLHAELPHSRLTLLDAGHFVWEDAATELNSLVLEWLDGGHLRV